MMSISVRDSLPERPSFIAEATLRSTRDSLVA
jgi:hypothetical protein